MSKNLLSALLLISTFAVYYLLISPLYSGTGGVWQPEQSVQDLRALNAQYDQTLAEADNVYNQAQTLRSQYNAVSDDDKAKMSVMVPQSVDTVRLLSEITDMIAAEGLVTKDLSVTDGSAPAATNLAAINVNFSVQTSYPKFKQLMDDFEKSLRLYSITTVSFAAPQKEGDLVTYQVQLETYHLK